MEDVFQTFKQRHGEDLRRNVWADNTDLEVMDVYMEFNHKLDTNTEKTVNSFCFLFYKRIKICI